MVIIHDDDDDDDDNDDDDDDADHEEEEEEEDKDRVDHVADDDGEGKRTHEMWIDMTNYDQVASLTNDPKGSEWADTMCSQDDLYVMISRWSKNGKNEYFDVHFIISNNNYISAECC